MKNINLICILNTCTSAAPNSGSSTKMVSSCVMTSWTKTTWRAVCASSPNSNAQKKCCSSGFFTIAGTQYFPLLHTTNCVFILFYPFLHQRVRDMLRNNFKQDSTIFNFRQLFFPEKKHWPSWAVMYCLYCDQAGCTSLGIHLVRPPFLWMFVLVIIRFTTRPTPTQSWHCIETLTNTGPVHDRPWQ